ncbi:MAG: amidohydrolase [Coriobacteriales bacterium]|nr:amidohydrolase [Coriobacteriales bacterium]
MGGKVRQHSRKSKLNATLSLVVSFVLCVSFFASCTSQAETNASGNATGATGFSTTSSAIVADIIFKNAVVQTMVDENDVASAVAIKGDEIVYVGDDAGAKDFEGANTEVIDLQGQMLIPGFGDGHIHGPGDWKDRLFGISLSDVFTREEYVQRIKDFVDANPDKPLYSGAPFMLNAWQQPDGTNPGPSKDDLDAISPDKPIIIYDVAHHSIWTNSAGLRLGGITRDTPVPQGGAIAKDESGEPTGYLTDAAADLVTSAASADMALTSAQEQEAIKEFQNEANSYGITNITNIVGALGGESNDSASYVALDKAGDLNLRMRIVNTAKPGMSPDEIVAIVNNTIQNETDLVSGGTVKLFADGVTESGTAVMTEPYLPEAGMGDDWHGDAVWATEDFNTMVQRLDKEGMQVHVHAIGDGAVQLTLDAYANALDNNGERDSRHTMTHVCAILPEDINRVSDLDVISALQFLWMYADPLYELEAAFIGTERALAMYPTKTMINSGCIITGASDAPVTPFVPLNEIEVGVTRNSPFVDEEDTDMFRAPDQALSVYQMLEAFTKNVAYQNFMEDEVGTIEVGKKADICVLDKNILKIDPKQISETKIVYTLSNGRIVYEG